MPLLDFGTTSGLAYRHNYQQDIANLRQEERLDDYARQKKAQEVTEISNLFKFGSANNEYDRNGLRTFSTDVSNKLGSFINQNPDWRYNVEKMMHVKQMSNSLLDNEHVQRSKYYDEQVKATQAYIQAHPDAVDEEDLVKYKEQMNNYATHGNIDGLGGKGGVYTFVPPQARFDFDKHFADLAGSVRVSDITNLPGDKELHHATRSDIEATAQAALADRRSFRGAALAFSNLPESVKAQYAGMDQNSAIYKWTADYMQGHTKDKVMNKNNDYGKIAYAHKLRMQEIEAKGTGEGMPNIYENTIGDLAYQLQQNPTKIAYNDAMPLEIMRSLFPAIPSSGIIQTANGPITVNLPPAVKVNMAPGISGMNVGGKFTGMANMEATITADEVETIFPNQGVLKPAYDSYWFDPTRSDTEESIDPSFSENITALLKPDGTPSGLYKLRIGAPIDFNNPSIALKYNAFYMGQKEANVLAKKGAKGKAQATTESKYIPGTVYTDIEGNKATYLGGDPNRPESWSE